MLHLDLRRFLIGLLVLAASAGLVLSARILFADPTSPWRAVVPAVATVVLVGITGVYAWLTYRLVQQSDPRARIRAEIEERALADVSNVLTRETYQVLKIHQEYPISIRDGSPPDMRLLIHRLDDIRPLVEGIQTHLKNLPGDLMEGAAALITLLVDAENDVLSLGMACSLESAAAEREKRIWTVEGAKSVDYTIVSRTRWRDWDDMVSGEKWELALKLAETLESRIEARRARLLIPTSGRDPLSDGRG